MKINYTNLVKVLEHLGYTKELIKDFNVTFDAELLKRMGNYAVEKLSDEKKGELATLLNSPDLSMEKLAEFFNENGAKNYDEMLEQLYKELLVETMDNILSVAPEDKKGEIKAILSS